MSEAYMTEPQQRGAGTAGESNDGPKVALVTGATGITGRALLRHLSKKPEFKKVYSVSRRKPDEEASNAVHLKLDLLDSSALKNKLEESNVKDVTHVYHAAFPGDTSNTDMSAATMLKNVVESLEGTGNPLDHVYVQEGTKAYGLHLGHDYKSPFKESDPRHIAPNFYYAFEDYLLERTAKGVSWKWSILRPGAVIGYSPGTVMSLLQVLAVYGTFCREYNLPLRFPGTAENYHAVIDCCDVDLLVEAAIWLSLHPEVGNEIYNISNGDIFRWEHIWPKVAEAFGLEAGPVQSLNLKTMLNTPDKYEMWKAIQKKYDLQPIPYSQLGACTLEFGDAWFALPDAFAVTTKLARAGFHQQVLDTDQVLFDKLEELQKKKIIPPYLSMS